MARRSPVAVGGSALGAGPYASVGEAPRGTAALSRRLACFVQRLGHSDRGFSRRETIFTLTVDKSRFPHAFFFRTSLNQ